MLDPDFHFDPFEAETLADPYPTWALLRAEDPIHWSPKLRAWLITRHEDCRRFFQDHEMLSADRDKVKRGKVHSSKISKDPAIRTISLDPPQQEPVRQLMTEALSPRIRAMPPRLEEVIRILFEAIEGAAARTAEKTSFTGTFDLVHALAYPLPIQMIAELFDLPEADRTEFRDVADEIARGMDKFFSSETVGENLRQMGAYFAGLISERRGTRGDDLIRRLCDAEHDGDRLNDMEVVAMATALVFGGYETTANLIANGMDLLFRYPEEREQLQADPTLAHLAIEEMLRFETPPQAISRTATCDFEWHGRQISEGDLVLGCLGSANRDEDAFTAPERFDVSRDPNPHISFGLGAHFCPGAQLTRIEVRALLPALLERYPRIRPAGEAVRRRTFILRGLESLPVRVD